MADRRAELERKKLKLQQLREMKEGLRSSATKERALLSDFNLATGNNVGSSPRSLTSSIRTDMSDADQILSSVGSKFFKTLFSFFNLLTLLYCQTSFFWSCFG